jgi:hypothetical protein
MRSPAPCKWLFIAYLYQYTSLHTAVLFSIYFPRLHKTSAHLNYKSKVYKHKRKRWYITLLKNYGILYMTTVTSVSTENDEMDGWILLRMRKSKHIFKMAVAGCNTWHPHLTNWQVFCLSRPYPLEFLHLTVFLSVHSHSLSSCWISSQLLKL